MAGVLIMLMVDTILYGLLAAWLDNIIPTEYGTRRQPWFFLVPSYWLDTTDTQVGYYKIKLALLKQGIL